MNVVAIPEQIVLPHTGEVVAVSDGAAIGRALEELRQLRAQVDEASRNLRRAAAAEKARQGTGTLRYGDVELVVKGGSETAYEAEKIEAGLRRAGMSEERIREIVYADVTWKVRAAELKKAAAANPAYDRVMRRHRTVTERTPDVEVKIAGSR